MNFLRIYKTNKNLPNILVKQNNLIIKNLENKLVKQNNLIFKNIEKIMNLENKISFDINNINNKISSDKEKFYASCNYISNVIIISSLGGYVVAKLIIHM